MARAHDPIPWAARGLRYQSRSPPPSTRPSQPTCASECLPEAAHKRNAYGRENYGREEGDPGESAARCSKSR
eukprot:6990426-Prymnesium_polylepis.1